MNKVQVFAVCLFLFATSAEAARKKQGSHVIHQFQAQHAAKLQELEELEWPSSGTCKVPKVQSECECEKFSLGSFGFKCSGCKNKDKWGYGCSLQCPEQCAHGCDFSGNCIPDPNAPPVPERCKRNDRIEKPTDKDVTWNERRECQACDEGFHGLMCEHACPKTCEKTADGTCGRGGECYECKDGHYGETCSQKCSPGCSSCVMVDGLVPDEDSPGEFLPAGYCPGKCSNDNYGDRCEIPCPANCKKYSGQASCSKDTGFCKQCASRKWHGDTCSKPCSEGCVDGTCDKSSGTCDRGCKDGWWGDACEHKCPTGTEGGCDRENGKPSRCVSGSFPSLGDDGTGVCESCPANCKNGVCHDDGTCSEGCLLGHFGDRCEQDCEQTCDGPCDAGTTDKKDGDCAACVSGFHGPRCTKKCHPQCKSCKQHGSVFNVIGANDCTECPEEEPSFLTDSGECKCIEGASRKAEWAKCTCDEPADVTKDAFFELTPRKRCRSICREGTREVFGDKRSKCMDRLKYKSVIYAEMDGFKQGSCAGNEYEIPIIREERSECVAKDYADNIVSF